MKKIITLCLFAFALLLNTQTGFAQMEVPDMSKSTNFKQEVKTLITALNLSDDQTKALSEAYVTREKTYQSNKPVNKAEFEKKFNATIERILTKEQFEKFKAIKN